MQWKNKRSSTKETHGDHKKNGSLLKRWSRGVTTLHHYKRISSRDLGWHRRETEEEEVKQSCFLTDEWNQRTLEVEQLERNDTTEMSELRALRSKQKQGTPWEPCRLKDMKQELNEPKEYGATPVSWDSQRTRMPELGQHSDWEERQDLIRWKELEKKTQHTG